MNKIKNIESLYELSFHFYNDTKQERHKLSDEEYDLDVTPLGEMELYCDFIAGIANSICKGKFPIKHLKKLKSMTIENQIPHFDMFDTYPLIVNYINNWEKIKTLCIEVLEQKQNKSL